MLVFKGDFKGNGFLEQMGFGLSGKSFKQFSNDFKFRRLFNSAMSMDGTSSQDAIDNTLLTLGLTADDISGSLMNAAKAADKTGVSFKAMGTSAQTATVATKALALAGNMLVTALVSFAITKAIQGIEYLANYADHMADNLEDTKGKVAENESAIADMNKELEETNKLIKELEGLSSLTPIQQEQLDMAKEQRLELERRLAVEQALLRVNQRQKNEDYKKAFNSRISENAGAQSVFDSASNNTLKQQFEIDAKAAGVDPSFIRDVSLFDAAGSGTMGTLGYTNAGRFEANKALYNQNLDKIKKLRQDTFEAEKQELDNDIAEYDKQIAQLESENAALISDMSEYVKNLQTAAEGISYIEGDHLTKQEQDTNNMLDYTNYVGESFADLENIARAQADFEAVFESEVFSEQAEKLKELATAGELTEKVFSESEFAGIFAEWEKLGWTAEQVAKQINDSIGKVPDAPKSSASSLYSSLFKNTEAYTKLTEAMNEQNEAGVLSFETYTALIEANSEFAELLTLTAEGYVLNTEAVWEYVEAQDEFNKLKAMVELEKINEQLLNSADLSRDEVDALMAQKAGWEQVITSITSATGALQQWKQAQASANQDAAFNEGKTMYDTIKEGLKTGKVGTDDFQESVDFMLGDDWEQNVGEGKTFTTKDAAYKAAQQKAKRYYGQKDERVGMQNFMQDLADNGFAEYDGKDFKLLEDVNLEEIAESFGMSIDAIKSMFGLMETYGAEINYEVDTSELTEKDRNRVENADTIKEIEQAQADVTAEIEEQQKILSDKNSTEEQKAAAQAEIDNLTTANEVLEEKKGILEGVEGAAEALTLDEALTKIAELETAIQALSEAGITVPVTLTEQYDALNELIGTLGGTVVGENGEVKGFKLEVNGIDDAKAKIEAIQQAIAAVQANPDISSDIKAQFTGASESAIEALNQVIEKDNGSTTITITPNDQFGDVLKGYVEPEQAWNVDMTVNAHVVYLDSKGNVIDGPIQPPTTPVVEYIDPSTGGSATVDYQTDLEKGGKLLVDARNSDITGIDSQINSFMAATDSLYSALDTIKNVDPSNEEANIEAVNNLTAAYQAYLDAYNELETVLGGGSEATPTTSNVEDNKKGILERMWEGVENFFGGSANAEEAIAYMGVEVDPDSKDNLISDVQDAVESTPATVGIDAETATLEEQIVEATPEEVVTTVNAEVDETPVIGDTTSTVTVGMDGSAAESEAANLEGELESGAVKPLELDTTEAESQHTTLLQKLTAGAKKVIEVVYTGIRDAFATGTKSAPGGPSIVDDGTGANAGPELILHNKQGTYEIGSGNGPRVTNLDKGDTVFTAKQTRSILSRTAKVGGFFRDGLNNAIAKGKAFATGVSGSMSWSSISSVISGKSSSSKKNSSSSNNTKKWKDYVEKLFDWIEIRLERLQTQTDKWILAASEAIGYAAKNAELDKALSSTSQQIDETTQAYQRYIEQADIIAKKSKLSAEIIQKIQDGTIDIASYKDSTKEKIQAYQEWYDKAMNCVEAVTELREQERDLASQKLDSILDHYQWRVDRLDAVVSSNDAMLGLKAATGVRVEESDYDKAIDATTQKIQELTDSRAALSEEFADMVSRGYIVEGSELWYQYTGELESLDETIIETKTDLQELIDDANNVDLTNLQYAMSALENSAATINQMMGLHESQGADHSAADYEKLIQNGMAQIKNLEAQNAELLKQQETLDPLSEKYQELQEQIDSNNQSILDMKTSQEQWNDAVVDLKISELEKYKDTLSKANDEYQRQKDLQQAIEDLERARTQRTQRVYREGVGFVFEQDQDALLEAQTNLESVVQDQLLDKIDDLIEAIQDSKADTNVYDANGVLLGQEYVLPDIGSYSDLLNGSKSKDVITSAMEHAKKAAYEQILKGVLNNTQTSVQIGDINIQSADNPEDLAHAIIDNLPNAILQELYSKT